MCGVVRCRERVRGYGVARAGLLDVRVCRVDMIRVVIAGDFRNDEKRSVSSCCAGGELEQFSKRLYRAEKGIWEIYRTRVRDMKQSCEFTLIGYSIKF